MRATLKTNVRKWCLSNFNDELDNEIKANVTFADVLACLELGGEIYDLLDVYDSIVREGVFKGLAQALNKDYSFVYDLWMSNLKY